MKEYNDGIYHDIARGITKSVFKESIDKRHWNKEST